MALLTILCKIPIVTMKHSYLAVGTQDSSDSDELRVWESELPNEEDSQLDLKG